MSPISNILKILVILVIAGDYCTQTQSTSNRYSLRTIKGGRVAKGSFYYGYQLCKQNNLQLATPDTEVKHKELLDFIVENNLVSVWTSGTDLAEEGQFYWMTNGKLMTFTNWHYNQPDNAGNIEHCVEYTPVYHEIRWNDISCEKNSSIVCEELDELDFNVRTTANA